MPASRFKIALHGHTIVLAIVCMLMLSVALWMILSTHDHLEDLSETDAHRKSEQLASMFHETMGPSAVDATDVARFVASARMVDHLSYLVVTDSVGAVRGAINEAGALRAGYRQPSATVSSDTAQQLFRFVHPLETTMFTGELFVGMEKQPLVAGVQKDKQSLRWVGWALLFVAIVLMASIGRFHALELSMSTLRQARRDLALQKGSLESEVHEQREKEAQLKQSEERYRSLLETTMEAAFKDLERQKKNLEKEVEEKTATQEVLNQTMRRLRMLNGIERMIVDEEPLDAIVSNAVDELQEILGADRISVIQVDKENGLVRIKAETGQDIRDEEDEQTLPLEWYRPFRKGLFVARNLGRMDELAEIEKRALEIGIQSYCRVTLTAGESVAGALHVAHSQPAQFDEAYLKVVRDVADLLSIALRQHVHQQERQRYNEELIAERDRAEEMARLKTAFLTNMTHEIRTPLSGIIGFAQVLHEELDDERQEFASLIQTAGQRLMSTINSVLDLSRLQADKATLNMEALDASRVVEHALQLLAPLATQRGVEFRYDVDADLEAMLDRKGLETVVNNLVGNAFKFTEEGSVTVQLFREQSDLALVVTDTGIGISSDFLPLLFDEFRQEHMGADRPAEGSGLGLAITSRIVEKMNGRIEVESAPGEGSTFRVVFKNALASESEKDTSSTTPDRTPVPPGTTNGGGTLNKGTAAR